MNGKAAVGRRSVIAVVALAAAALVAGLVMGMRSSDDPVAAGSGERPVAPLEARQPTEDEQVCSKSLISDWYVDGRVDARYRKGCYESALGRLPSSPREYSSVYEDLRRAHRQAAVSDVIDESEGVFRTIGLGSPAGEVQAVLGPGASEGGFAPLGRLPAEAAVPLALPNPPGAERERPQLLRYRELAFLLARGQVFAMTVTVPQARTGRGVRLGADISAVRRSYERVSCYRAPGGERPGFGVLTYPICRIAIGARRYLSFGGDPIRSFTLFSREPLR